MKVFLIAGEPSGDKLGAALMEGLCVEVPQVEFLGVGGPMMQDLNLESLFPMDELSVMGIAEILPKYRHLKRRIRQTADAVIAAKPDVLITIDSPDFCLRVARLVKAGSDIRTVHYVAPSVWAWRAGRAAKMAHYIDHVLALLPFEPPLMQAAGMECDFVGHPIVAEPPVTPEEITSFEARYGLIEHPVLAILPGSRKSEISRLGPIFEAVNDRLAGQFKTVIVPTLPHLEDTLNTHLSLRGPAPRIMVTTHGLSPAAAARERLVAMACADVALAASGTVSLELAAARTPMVIAYDMNWLSYQIISRLALTDTVTLVNLVSETRVVPEFLGTDCRPDPIAEALKLLATAQAEQLAAIDLTMQRLGRGGIAPGLRAARAVLARL